MSGKVARLLKAARSPPVTDVCVDWLDDVTTITTEEEDFELVEAEPTQQPPSVEPAAIKISLFGDNVSEPAETGPPKAPVILASQLPHEPVQQGPLQLPSLYPGMRYSVFAIVQASALKEGIPQQLKVIGRVNGSRQEVELVVPVTQVASFSAAPIHTLAARKLIESAEDGHHALPAKIAKDSSLLKAYLKAKIIDLGTRYSLTSTHTSFVAVDERDVNPGRVAAQPARAPVSCKPQSPISLPAPGGVFGRQSKQAIPMPALRTASFAAPSALFGQHQGGLGGSSRGVFGSLPPPPSAPAALHDSSVIRSRSAASSVFGNASTSTSPQMFGSSSSVSAPAKKKIASPFATDHATPRAVDYSDNESILAALARLQVFDGHFALAEDLLKLVRVSREAALRLVPNQPDDVVATILVLRYLKNELKAMEESYTGMFEKAQMWLDEQGSWNQVQELIA